MFFMFVIYIFVLITCYAHSGDDWLKLANFANKTGLSMLFDLNALLRENNKWVPDNPKELINFSNAHKINVDWQLGNGKHIN